MYSRFLFFLLLVLGYLCFVLVIPSFFLFFLVLVFVSLVSFSLLLALSPGFPLSSSFHSFLLFSFPLLVLVLFLVTLLCSAPPAEA